MASRPPAPAPPTKRSSAAPPAEAAPKPPCVIHPLAIVADKAQIVGSHPVEIGEQSVLHPHCRIRADHGPVKIGKRCIIQEAATVGAGGGGSDIHIGNGVNVEAGAVVEAKSIGDGTLIEAKAKIGKGAVIGKYCKITPGSEVRAEEVLADYTVLYGDDKRRINRTMLDNSEVREAKNKGQQMHLDLLRKLIPDASAKWR